MSKYKAGILGIASYLPPRTMTNQDLEKIVETSDEWIKTRTGIESRQIAEPDQAASDLAIAAGKRALEDANISAADLDLIIVASLTPDHMFPSTACIVQEALGAKGAAAFDLSAACSGFIYALATGAQFIQSGLYRHVLVIGSEVLSKIVDWQDRGTCVLFGDGAGAAILGPVEGESGFHSFVLGSDGSGAQDLIQPAGGSRYPVSPEAIEQKDDKLKMNGREVFKFAVRVMEKASREAVSKAGMDLADIDCFIPHQANIRIIEPAMKKLGISEDKLFVNLHKYGNMSAASIPVAMDEAVKAGKAKKGDHILLVGFGAGLTWGACVVTL